MRAIANFFLKTITKFNRNSRIVRCTDSILRQPVRLMTVATAHKWETWPCCSRTYATNSTPEQLVDSPLDNATFERVCSDTLDALCDYFEELTENASDITGTDVAYSDGVLTVNLGLEHGTYVINRQTPNKQIWLSSPTSGPKRFDFMGPASGATGSWIYKHSGETLHLLLQHEISQILNQQKVDFTKLTFSS